MGLGGDLTESLALARWTSLVYALQGRLRSPEALLQVQIEGHRISTVPLRRRGFGLLTGGRANFGVTGVVGAQQVVDSLPDPAEVVAEVNEYCG